MDMYLSHSFVIS
uniref:Uncharacterized protein n=1 Tax=Moniliophthora roreri TaxID=221103 RepID=A0A0W0FV30_MONRR